MLSIPSPAGKDDSDLRLCALRILTDKGNEMDSNINAHTHTPDQCQRGGSVYDKLGLGAGLVELLSWFAAWLPRGGTSIMRGLSMMRARRSPFSTIPMIHAPPAAAWPPAPELWLFISEQNLAACSLGRHTSSPPGGEDRKRDFSQHWS